MSAPELRVSYDKPGTVVDMLDFLVDGDPIELRDIAINLLHDVETLKAQLAAAEARGRQWAIDTLRDTAAYELWVTFGGGHSRTGWPHESHGPQFADYLEAMATEEASRAD